MRILLAHNSLYYPSFGGGDKSNRFLMEALAVRGHDVVVISRVERFGEDAHRRLGEELENRGVRAEAENGSISFRLNGVLVYTLTRNAQWRAFFTSHLNAFDPDVIITSTDDPGHLLFDVARRAERARLVYLIRATIAVPFGPDSSMVSAAKKEALREADGVVGVSEHVAAYAREYGGLDAIHLPISLMDQREPPYVGRFNNPYVTMVNPCAVKGISIFLALAERLPQFQFAGVPLWGTTAEDLAAMRSLPNIMVLKPVDNVDELFQLTKVALVPSVWAEARSRVVVEAMLRGVPVVASNAGGLKEAKLGVPYLLPVNAVRHYKPVLDENLVPVAEVPLQDIGPWVEALHKLTADPEHWKAISEQSREAALSYARTLTAEPFEAFLFELLNRSKRSSQVVEPAPQLSESKRKLIAIRLKKRLDTLRWFPALQTAPKGDLTLFCFPYAGGGTLAHRGWVAALPKVRVVPVLLPGREARASEAAFDRMRPLIDALTTAITPVIDGPFALFGHSMGAGIAFELARSLRRTGARQPSVLIVSGARAPQLRTQLLPERSEKELIEELRRLQGLPEDLLDNSATLKQMAPALFADTRLYRNYVYEAELPLDMPIVAYGGTADPNVRSQDLDAWREQTTAQFRWREFDGGHFYLRTCPEPVLEAIQEDLKLA